MIDLGCEMTDNPERTTRKMLFGVLAARNLLPESAGQVIWNVASRSGSGQRTECLGTSQENGDWKPPNREENEARIAAPSDGGGRLSTAIELGSCQLVTNTNIIPGYESI